MKILFEPDVEKAMAILHQKGSKRIVVTSTNLSADQAKLFVYCKDFAGVKTEKSCFYTKKHFFHYFHCRWWCFVSIWNSTLSSGVCGYRWPVFQSPVDLVGEEKESESKKTMKFCIFSEKKPKKLISHKNSHF